MSQESEKKEPLSLRQWADKATEFMNENRKRIQELEEWRKQVEKSLKKPEE